MLSHSIVVFRCWWRAHEEEKKKICVWLAFCPHHLCARELGVICDIHWNLCDVMKQINSWFLFRNSLKSKSFAYVSRASERFAYWQCRPQQRGTFRYFHYESGVNTKHWTYYFDMMDTSYHEIWFHLCWRLAQSVRLRNERKEEEKKAVLDLKNTYSSTYCVKTIHLVFVSPFWSHMHLRQGKS